MAEDAAFCTSGWAQYRSSPKPPGTDGTVILRMRTTRNTDGSYRLLFSAFVGDVGGFYLVESRQDVMVWSVGLVTPPPSSAAGGLLWSWPVGTQDTGNSITWYTDLTSRVVGGVEQGSRPEWRGEPLHDPARIVRSTPEAIHVAGCRGSYGGCDGLYKGAYRAPFPWVPLGIAAALTLIGLCSWLFWGCRGNTRVRALNSSLFQIISCTTGHYTKSCSKMNYWDLGLKLGLTVCGTHQTLVAGTGHAIIQTDDQVTTVKGEPTSATKGQAHFAELHVAN
ncbi:hypothetical protein BJ684DRAFT_20132 [Piptocephalis cylindrospora]|uniref:Uncharacterized protein n=1 Tax=Piptocephalis cylindrospora TaxID=1907219 RepID=A0A4P9Y3J6_9FUNG|nr:hypothetical protein BJ684DRAFT_20132 [Piptocephalis cylindrospora]|eukprot:RKP13373.1 hypothetical protein BJ684DRAFT_20132 [Piptocephalis cylindrospora]